MKYYFHWLMVIIIVIGVVARVYSVQWNVFRHGDIVRYSVAAESIVARGDLLIDSDISTPHSYSLKEKGGKFLEINPVWSFAGSLFVLFFGLSGFVALKLLSFLSGIALLAVVYFYCLRIGGSHVAFFALALSAVSYLLIDYSGNGALYIFQALLYIVFLLLLQNIERPRHHVEMGMLLGFSILFNHQAIVLFVAYGCYLLWYFHGNYKEALRRISLAFILIVLFYLPWGIRNVIFYGSPVFPTASAYFWDKLGVLKTVQDGVITYQTSFGTFLQLAVREITNWMPHNIYFINRQLFILAPLIDSAITATDFLKKIKGCPTIV